MQPIDRVTYFDHQAVEAIASETLQEIIVEITSDLFSPRTPNQKIIRFAEDCIMKWNLDKKTCADPDVQAVKEEL